MDDCLAHCPHGNKNVYLLIITVFFRPQWNVYRSAFYANKYPLYRPSNS